jgi:hypothetical protein
VPGSASLARDTRPHVSSQRLNICQESILPLSFSLADATSSQVHSRCFKQVASAPLYAQKSSPLKPCATVHCVSSVA